MHRRANASAGEALPQVNDDLLGKFSRHRQYNTPIARELMLDTGTRDIGQKIANCALALKADLLIHPDQQREVNLKAARVCNTRLCPFCEWRRTRVWRARLSDGLTRLYGDQPKLRGVFLTLTVRNPRLEDLGETLTEMNRAWDRFSKRSFFPTDLWFRRTETTVTCMPGQTGFTVHPHFHVLLLVKPSYFSRDYIKQTTWQKEWMDAPASTIRRSSTCDPRGRAQALERAAKKTPKEQCWRRQSTQRRPRHSWSLGPLLLSCTGS